MARVISDAEVWGDLVARILGHTRAHKREPIQPEVDDLMDATATELGVDRQRVSDVYLTRLFNLGAG